jgi:hypothetical protein
MRQILRIIGDELRCESVVLKLRTQNPDASGFCVLILTKRFWFRLCAAFSMSCSVVN